MEETPDVVVAVDPGLSGAVASVTYASRQLRVRRDFKSYDDVADAILAETHGLRVAAVVERVNAAPIHGRKQGTTSMFNFGKAAGTALGALRALSVPYIEVVPQVWQHWIRRAVKLGSEDQARASECLYAPDFLGFDSRVYALKLFPEAVGLLHRAKDHNTADAICLAAFGRAQVVLAE